MVNQEKCYFHNFLIDIKSEMTSLSNKVTLIHLDKSQMCDNNKSWF